MHKWSWSLLSFIKLLIIYNCNSISGKAKIYTIINQYITLSNVTVLFHLYALFLIPCCFLQFIKRTFFLNAKFIKRTHCCRYLKAWICRHLFNIFLFPLYNHLKARPHIWVHNLWTWTTTKGGYWGRASIGKGQK